MNDVRQILRSNYSPSLYLEMTNDCNLNCKYCYIHDKKFNSKVLSVGDIVSAINYIYPSKIIITGGEPLLYPKEIAEFILYLEAGERRHCIIDLCTNLCLDISDENVKLVLSKIDWLQTTYSIDRFRNNDLYSLFSHNLHRIKSDFGNIKYRDIIVTLTARQLKEPIGDLVDKLTELKPTGVYLEPLSFKYTEDLHRYDEYYKACDEYMNNTFEVIDYDINLNYNNWEKSLDNKMPMSCTVCSDGISKILTPDNVLYDGCLCNVIKDKNVYKQKFIDKCAECEYYKYCQGDCKRFGYYCAFPKKSFDRFLKIYNKRKKVINNG